LRTLAKFTIRLPDLSQLLKYMPMRLSAEKELATAQDLVAHAVLEPDARLVNKVHERAALRAVIKDTGKLSALLQVRKRYRLLSGQRFSSFPEALQQHSRAFDAALATALENAALTLQGEQPQTRNDIADVHALLKTSYTEYHRIDSLPDDLSVEWELRFMLDQQIITLLKDVEQSALDSVAYGKITERVVH
jgi:hypothetical protein